MGAKRKQFRSCRQCRAFRYHDGRYYCLLHYAQDTKRGAPLEPCPKPKTNREYFPKVGRQKNNAAKENTV